MQEERKARSLKGRETGELGLTACTASSDLEQALDGAVSKTPPPCSCARTPASERPTYQIRPTRAAIVNPKATAVRTAISLFLWLTTSAPRAETSLQPTTVQMDTAI